MAVMIQTLFHLWCEIPNAWWLVSLELIRIFFLLRQTCICNTLLWPRRNGMVSSLSQGATSKMCHQMRQNVKYSLSKQLTNLQPCSLLTNPSSVVVPHFCFFWTGDFWLTRASSSYAKAYQPAWCKRKKKVAWKRLQSGSSKIVLVLENGGGEI